MAEPRVILTRSVRLVVNPTGGDGVQNTYAGAPTPRGLPRFYQFDARCIGHADPVTGYLVDIKTVDAAVRSAVAPLLARACAETPGADPAAILPGLVRALRDALPAELRSLRWRITPYHSCEVDAHSSIALLREKFDFAASHRLNVPSLSPEQNRALFGKCNNAAGHGHNYQVEPCIAVETENAGPDAFTFADLERLTHEAIIRRFDHRHLNTDTPEFAEGSGINPSVENIAAVFFRLLDAAIRAQPKKASLRSITVWETDRTSATFPAD